MTAIERYLKLKAEYTEAQYFVALMDDPTKAKPAGVQFYSDLLPKGSSRPEKMPNALRAYCVTEAEKKADAMMRLALSAMASELQSIANSAIAEYRAIAADAGITLPS